MSRRMHALSWAKALDAYFLHLRAQRSAARTIDGQRRHLEHLHAWLGGEPQVVVTVGDLRAYVCDLLTGAGSPSRRPVSAATAANVASTIRSFFSWLTAEGLLREDPSARLERPHVATRSQRPVLTPKEVARVLAVPDVLTATGLRDRAFLDLAYACGLRRNEILSLDLGDVDHREREVHVRCGKGGKARIVPLTPSAYQRVKDYLDDGRGSLASNHADSAMALFLGARGRRLDANAVKRLFAELRTAARLSKPFTPHRLRHACAVHLLQGGANLRVIQQVLGHEHLDTTAIYLHLDREDVRRSLILHHPRERLGLEE